MKADAKQKEIITFSPGLRAGDWCANYWMRQVTIRLRREVCWCWHERGLQPPNDPAILPPFSDKVSATLDMSRFWAEKRSFFLSDPTARYLTDQLDNHPPRAQSGPAAAGSFGWVVDELKLDDLAAFVLALGLTVVFDASMGSVIAACLNDQNKSFPNLALAQKLWDEPEQVLQLSDPFHPLFRYGLIKHGGQSVPYPSETAWETPITVPSLVAHQLLFPENPFPHGLVVLEEAESDGEMTNSARLVSARLSSERAAGLRVVPVIGARGSRRRESVRAIAKADGKTVVEYRGDPAALEDRHYLNSIATVCWLKDSYLFFGKEPSTGAAAEKQRGEPNALPSATIPATVFLAINDRVQLAQCPTHLLTPAVQVPPATYQERVEFWKQDLGTKAAGIGSAISECARRFRFEKETIRAVCAELKELPGKINTPDLMAACRAEVDSDIGELASRVAPRFAHEELILPHKQRVMFAEILKAMESLTAVHYGWGTATAWNESGISVLFAGPPGTGKTMAAEILSIKLDLPMYRIDLSQVVNKYIGETEKNLKRVFDAADVSDIILFFDEADSLFGRRTEVSDAHDRYANLEISYLLERMERFKGLAILATNRKKDLDEAFLRRLRYIVDFPLPEAPERKLIWRQVIPDHADSSQLQFDFLAEQFPLSGGNIRSIVFNACLQCAEGQVAGKNGEARRLTMQAIIAAVKREYDKMNRTLSLEQYGSFARLVEQLERE